MTCNFLFCLAEFYLLIVGAGAKFWIIAKLGSEPKYNSRCGVIRTPLHVTCNLYNHCCWFFFKSLAVCSGNAVPTGYETEENLDVSLRAEESTLEDYESIPVEQVCKPS